MLTDRYGHELTTSSAAAAADWTAGCDRFLAGDGGALEAFEQAIHNDAEFALAYAGKARVLSVRGSSAEARSEADRADSFAVNATERERSQIAIIRALAYGDSSGALARIRAHVERYPRDAFALQPATNVFGLIGLSGRQEREREVFNLLEPLAAHYGDDWWYLGALGFWYTELGDLDRGFELNRRSLELNPRNGNAAHGLAHSWYERGDDTAGIQMLQRFLDGCPRDAAMHCHLSWHLALFALRQGDPERMWAVYRDAIDPRACAPAPPLNVATDAVSILWQAQLHGEDVPADRWSDARDFIAANFSAPASGFLEVHRALACAMAGDAAKFEAALKPLRQAATAGTLPWGTVTPDAIEGLKFFAMRDDTQAIARLAPTLAELVRIGGSHAQRDLFAHTLIAAYLRAGLGENALAVAQRIPWRVDSGAMLLIRRGSTREAHAAELRL